MSQQARRRINRLYNDFFSLPLLFGRLFHFMGQGIGVVTKKSNPSPFKLNLTSIQVIHLAVWIKHAHQVDIHQLLDAVFLRKA